MLRKVLDANRLIRYWQTSRPENISDARRLARQLIDLKGTGAIVTPVVIEFVGGTRDSGDLARARAFLDEFDVIDNGRILAEDFVHALRLAEPRRGITRRRSFADCLIRAIADRLHYEVDTEDAGMPRSLPRRSVPKSQQRRRR